MHSRPAWTAGGQQGLHNTTLSQKQTNSLSFVISMVISLPCHKQQQIDTRLHSNKTLPSKATETCPGAGHSLESYIKIKK